MKESSPSQLTEYFYHEIVLDFVKRFFCVNLDDLVFFFPHFILLRHTTLIAFCSFELPLQSWDKAHWVMVYGHGAVRFVVLLVFELYIRRII